MTNTYAFKVSGMHCPGCAILIDETVEDLTGVVSSHTSVKQGLTVVTSADPELDPRAIEDAIAEAGYGATVTDKEPGTHRGRLQRSARQ